MAGGRFIPRLLAIDPHPPPSDIRTSVLYIRLLLILRYESFLLPVIAVRIFSRMLLVT